jgi:hypothetical protein
MSFLWKIRKIGVWPSKSSKWNEFEILLPMTLCCRPLYLHARSTWAQDTQRQEKVITDLRGKGTVNQTNMNNTRTTRESLKWKRVTNIKRNKWYCLHARKNGNCEEDKKTIQRRMSLKTEKKCKKKKWVVPKVMCSLTFTLKEMYK